MSFFGVRKHVIFVLQRNFYRMNCLRETVKIIKDSDVIKNIILTKVSRKMVEILK